ncbi:electron transport complex subunit RsxC [Ectothiorhodospiraceae bacterium BW-2]|nr:electron transport complex subunit RsxC [Ectothiorhodospiraceae bacterium BW-2]
MSQPLWQFHGGIKLEGFKRLSNQTPATPLPLPTRLTLPLQQHIGQPARPVVQEGERVLKGQLLAESSGYVSAPIHAPTSGTILAIAPRITNHPSGQPQVAIELTPDGAEQWIERQPVESYLKLAPADLRQKIHSAGIVGMGGAGFPTHIKLNTPSKQATGTLIINGAECEPFITCDDRLMRERADAIISGARIMRHALHAVRCVIGIEDNKPEAMKALTAALQLSGKIDIEIVAIPTLYPAGGEKQLIKTLTGKEVPSGGIPLDVNVVCQNVATATAVHDAIREGRPLINRYVTVSGELIRHPQNFIVPLGASVQSLIQAASGTTEDHGETIMGGPMMGIRLNHGATPITKTANAILVRPPQPTTTDHQPCIRCGECATVCPANLLPQQLYWHARAKELEKVQDYALFDCIECGCCAWVCPSTIPLVHYYRYAKTEIWEQERLKKAADIARERHEFRQFRLQREKEERAVRHQQQKSAISSKGDGETSDKKALIEAALARAKAKKSAAAHTDS